MDTERRIEILVAWATGLGARLHPSVEVYHDAHTGISLRVKPSAASPVAPYEPIVTLPTSLSLSYLNALPAKDQGERSEPLSAALVAQLKPHVIGRLLLVREYLRARDSFWWPYIQALPQPDDPDSWALPPFWPADDAELLDGTNVELGIEKIRNDVAAEVRDVARVLDEAGEGDQLLRRSFNRTLYQWAYCIFSSRSFRPSLVLCDELTGLLPKGLQIDDFSVLLPLFDLGNHDMTVDVQWELAKESRTCELKVGKAHQPGQQVFNNYSMKTNAELLLGYGFMVPVTDGLHNDYTHVRKRADTPVASEEYLISLRPMDHQSSVLGRRRTGPEDARGAVADVPMLGAFRHVQPDMAWDIFCMLTDAEQRKGMLPGDREHTLRDTFIGGNVGPDCAPYLEQTVAVIQHKMLQELERLEETEVEIASGQESDLTRNQRLALDYRDRCRQVLENTLVSIDSCELLQDGNVDGYE